MYVHSNKIWVMEFSAGFKTSWYKIAVAQKLLSILILPQLQIKDWNLI